MILLVGEMKSNIWPEGQGMAEDAAISCNGCDRKKRF
jgi:hypothetical protein